MMCDAVNWQRITRVARAPVVLMRARYDTARVGHPPLPNSTGASCWFLATMHVLACHTQFLQAISHAVLHHPDLAGVAAWIPVHAAPFGLLLVSDYFVTAAALAALAGRASTPTFITDSYASDLIHISTSQVPRPDIAGRASTCTDRSIAAFVLALHIIGRRDFAEIGAATNTQLGRLVLEAILLRHDKDLLPTLTDEAVLRARHVFASPEEVLTVLLAPGLSPTPHPLQRLLSTPAFCSIAGLGVTVTQNSCTGVAMPTSDVRSTLILTNVSCISMKHALETNVWADCIDAQRLTLTWHSDWLFCQTLIEKGSLPASLFKVLHEDIYVSATERARVVAVATRPAGQAHYVAFLRTDNTTPLADAWILHNDNAPARRESADEHTFYIDASKNKYEVTLMLLKKEPIK